MSMLSLHISLDSIDSMHRNVMPALAISCRAHTHTYKHKCSYIYNPVWIQCSLYNCGNARKV